MTRKHWPKRLWANGKQLWFRLGSLLAPADELPSRTGEYTQLGITHLEQRRVLSGVPGGSSFNNPDVYFYDSSQGSLLSVGTDGGVLTNDFLAPGEGPFSATLFGAAPPGLVFNPDGSFDYFGGGSTAPVTFRYQLVTAAGVSGPETVTIHTDFIDTFEDVGVAAGGFFVDTGEAPRGPGPEPDFYVRISAGTLEPTPFFTSLFIDTNPPVTINNGFNGGDFIEFSGTSHDLNTALDGLFVQPPIDYGGEILLFLEVSDDPGFSGSFSDFQAFRVFAEPVADVPTLLAPPVVFFTEFGQPAPLPLGGFSNDLDGSEFQGQSFIGNIPQGVFLTEGNPVTGPGGNIDGYILAPGQLDFVQIVVFPDAPQSFSLNYFSDSVEFLNSDFAVGFTQFTVTRDTTTGPPPGDPPPPPPAGGEDPPPDDFGDENLGVGGNSSGFTGNAGGPAGSNSPGGGKTGGPTAPTPAGPASAPAAPPPVFVLANQNNEGGGSGAGGTAGRSRGRQGRLGDLGGQAGDEVEEDYSSVERSGLYIRAFSADGLGDMALLPDDLSSDYNELLQFLRTLPNGEYSVYFRMPGQTHAQALARQTLMKVRVVNQQLNPNAEDFKPAGEIEQPALPQTARNPGDDFSAVVPRKPLVTDDVIVAVQAEQPSDRVLSSRVIPMLELNPADDQVSPELAAGLSVIVSAAAGMVLHAQPGMQVNDAHATPPPKQNWSSFPRRKCGLRRRRYIE